MLRSLITLLVGLPLLMPPGMCLCQFLPDSCDEDTHTSEAPHAATPTHNCPCHHCRETRAVSTDDDHRECQQAPLPCQDHHAPGCPALKPADHSRWSESGSLRVARIDPLLGPSCPLSELPNAASLPPVAAVPPPACPLYLTVQVLLV